MWLEIAFAAAAPAVDVVFFLFSPALAERVFRSLFVHQI